MIGSLILKNFKGTTGAVALEQLNLFLGRSGKGKSTILEALTLGYLGYHPAVGKTNADALTFASGDTMSIGLCRESGLLTRVFTRTARSCSSWVEAQGRKLSAEEIEQELGSFPEMLDLGRFLALSDDKKTAFFFGLSRFSAEPELMRRRVVDAILSAYSSAVPVVLDLRFGGRGIPELSDPEFDELETIILSKLDDVLKAALPELIASLPVESDGQKTLESMIGKIGETKKRLAKTRLDMLAANRQLTDQQAGMRKVAGSSEEIAAQLTRLQGERIAIDKERYAGQEVQKVYARNLEAIAHQKELLAKKEQALASREQLIAAVPEPAKLRAEVEEQARLVIRYRSEVADAEARIAALDSEIQTHALEKAQIDGARTLAAQMEAQVAGVSVNCPKCGASFDAKEGVAQPPHLDTARMTVLETQIEALTTKNERFVAEKLALRAKLDAAATQESSLRGALETNGKARVEAETLRLEIDDLKLQLTKQEAAQEAGKATGDEAEFTERMAAIDAQIKEVQAKHKELELVRQLEISVQKSVFNLKKTEALLEACKVADKAVREVRNSLTAQLTGPLEEGANGLLREISPDLALRFEIEDGEFRILCRNLQGIEVSFATLSGGERVVYSLALLAAFITVVNPSLPLLLAELGEVSGDIVPPLLAAIRKRVEGTNIQVVLASCHRDFTPPTDWNVHDLEKE